jgi:hypothetical protein
VMLATCMDLAVLSFWLLVVSESKKS